MFFQSSRRKEREECIVNASGLQDIIGQKDDEVTIFDRLDAATNSAKISSIGSNRIAEHQETDQL